VRINDLPENERPREKLRYAGVQALSNAELMAVLIRVGLPGESAIALAERILEQMGGIAGIHATCIEELCNIHGIGLAKAAQIKAAIELGSRLQASQQPERRVINSPQKVVEELQFEILATSKELLWVLALNTRNHLLRKVKLYEGTRSHSSVRAAEVFEVAIQNHATALILAHNHPSGDPTPSKEDIALTKQIIEGGKLLDIKLLDHVIIVVGNHVSIKEQFPELFHN